MKSRVGQVTAVATLISKQRETYKPITCSAPTTTTNYLHNVTVFCCMVMFQCQDVEGHRTVVFTVESDVSVSAQAERRILLDLDCWSKPITAETLPPDLLQWTKRREGQKKFFPGIFL